MAGVPLDRHASFLARAHLLTSRVEKNVRRGDSGQQLSHEVDALLVTAPRAVVASRTYVCTRRCTQRMFLLRPDPHVEQIYLYCLGEAVARFGMTLYAFVAMSNHQHLLIRDNLGNYPKFLEHLNKMLAKALNAHWGRCENLWANEQPNMVVVVEPADVFRKLVYVLANPVADHLVDRVAHWPGATSFAQHLSGRIRTVERPRGFFREDGPMPARVTLRLERPEGFAELDEAAWVEKLTTAVRAEEDKARSGRARSGLKIVGRKAILAASPRDTASSFERRRNLRPIIACRNVRRRMAELDNIVAFRVAYRDALQRWCAGERTVEFPVGTYRMRKFGVQCTDLGATWQAAPLC
jgi:REP element-mobilizing transposase RayT